MKDDEYRAARARLIEARQYIAENEDDVLHEAVKRGEAYVLHAWYHYVRCEWPFLSLEEAVDRAQDDCSPEYIIGPEGRKYNPFTGEERDRG